MTKINMKLTLNDHKNQLIALAIFAIAYVPVFMVMWYRWWAADSYYSHGVLIPFVSAFFIWQMKDELIKMKPKESPWAFGVILAGVVLYLFASVFRVNFIAAFSMLFVLTGLILYFYGTEIFKKIAFPILFLFFMIPLPSVIITRLSFKLKLFAAELATHVIRAIGIKVVQAGSIIQMPHAHVVVDDVCSGLRSLISLLALGSIFAYWFKGPVWKRLLIFVLTVPIAIVTNMVRVVILAVVSEIWGAQYAEGFVHDATGLLVFVLAFILLYVVVKLIEE